MYRLKESNLWHNDTLIATECQLDAAGYAVSTLYLMSQKQLANVAKKMTPKPVKLSSRSIEDMLGY